MQSERFTGGPADTHSYLVFDPASRQALVIDAPQETARRVLRRIGEEQLQPLALVLTHAHFDHLLDAPAWVAEGLPVFGHAAEEPLLRAPQPALFGLPLEMPDVRLDRTLAEGDELRVGPVRFEVLHTPGHSPGSISLYAAEIGMLFSGDVLFAGGMGRFDLPLADEAVLKRTLARLADLPPETKVYPGHGAQTTIGAEAPWVRQYVRG